jgi:phosphoribosylglycinamide formyltransferase-1
MKNIVILISGGGSNMAAIVRAAQTQAWEKHFGARIGAVISNRHEAQGLVFAQKQGIPTQTIDHKTFASRASFDQALALAISHYDLPDQPALVVLAGFMRILTPAFVTQFEGRLINIHPSLLPAFPGLHTHQRAIDAGCQFAGVTVHRVTAELDFGPILAQAVVPVLQQDTEKSLADRVLTQEHLIYPRVVRALVSGETF